MNEKICAKAYTESDNTVLVLEGLYKQDREGYYPASGSMARLGTVVCGKEHISITVD